MIITPIEELEREIDDIEAYLSEVPPDEPDLVIERGNELSVYISRTGKMLADARYHQDKAISESIVYNLGKNAGYPASMLKQLVESTCRRENYLVNSIERLNKAATHQLDWLRTVISKAKEEMRYSNGINQR
ncbi:hypothetical protein [Butyricimonas faecihominis]|uniref:hypothetical protein n=1 Tax=Butyricimonas faecihominis TaxID=1472416 RepID=UPI0026DC6286|nr:hypothetical protein [Butyricimonas faecihominis]